MCIFHDRSDAALRANNPHIVMAAHLLHDAEKEINYLTCDCTKYYASGSSWWESVKFGRKSKAISLELLIWFPVKINDPSAFSTL